MHGDGINAIQNQLETSSLALPAVPASEAGITEFSTTEKFWQALLSEQVRARKIIMLRRVLLSEWFPRSPGLFLTPEAVRARKFADSFMMPLTEQERKIYLASRPSDPVVYNVSGKAQMLRAGVGCLRFKERNTADGRLYFMSACSSHKAHEGVPLALTPDQYSIFIDEVTRLGAMPCTITGELMFMHESMLNLYKDYAGVPRLYLLVREIVPLRRATLLNRRRPTATAAVMFKAKKGSWTEVQAAYVTFIPGLSGTLANSIGWLERYVEKYTGTIITDFDEQMTRFPNAVFSLNKIANAALDEHEIAENLGSDRSIDRLMAQQVVYGDVINNFIETRKAAIYMNDVIKNIGAGATVINRSFLNNALNRTRADYGPEAMQTLEVLADVVSRTGNQDAIDSVNALIEELDQPQPSKNRLMTWLTAIKSALPDVAEVATAIAKLVTLFH